MTPNLPFPRPVPMEFPPERRVYGYWIDGDKVRGLMMIYRGENVQAFQTEQDAHRELAYRLVEAHEREMAEILTKCGMEGQGK